MSTLAARRLHVASRRQQPVGRIGQLPRLSHSSGPFLGPHHCVFEIHTAFAHDADSRMRRPMCGLLADHSQLYFGLSASETLNIERTVEQSIFPVACTALT